MKITVVGTGYVGLVTGACFAEMGNDVLCVDVDGNKIEKLRCGELPFFEPGLDELVTRNIAAKRLHFSCNVQEGVRFGIIQVIAVGTPPGEGGAADMKHVLAAARTIGRYMTEYKVVVNKSTVPVGTAAAVQHTVAMAQAERGMQVPFSVVSNPEFLKEGAAVKDCMEPDRIIVGAGDDRATRLMQELYAPFESTHEKVVLMDIRSAELTKYAANAMLATRISFMNEMAMLAEKLGADIEQVRRGMGSDPRIGHHFLNAGCGYGGSCFPKDVKALVHSAKDVGEPMQLLRAVDSANDRQKQVLVNKIVERFGQDLEGRHFAMWGLAFKPDTDDMREAPSLVIIAELLSRGARVTAYDPVAMDRAQRLFRDAEQVAFAASAEAALVGADALVIVTEWKAFRTPDFERMHAELRHPIIFDGRNLFDPTSVYEAGFEYFPIGRRHSLVEVATNAAIARTYKHDEEEASKLWKRRAAPQVQRIESYGAV